MRLQNGELRKWQRRTGSVQAWRTYSARKPDKLRLRIQQGVPDPVRGFVWKAMAAARSPTGFRKQGRYQRLLEQVNAGPDAVGARLAAALEQVDKDVPRTMTGHIYFRTGDMQGQKALARVLKAYAVFDPGLGYTQGMSSYAAVLLLYMREVNIAVPRPTPRVPLHAAAQPRICARAWPPHTQPALDGCLCLSSRTLVPAPGV